VYDDDRVFDALDTLVAEGRAAAVRRLVETPHERCGRSGVATVQIVLNVFAASRWSGASCPAAGRASAHHRAVPLASGLLSGSTTCHAVRARTTTAATTAREAFDVGETFAGVPFDVGVVRGPAMVAAIDTRRATLRRRSAALRWDPRQPASSTVIAPVPVNAVSVRAKASRRAELAPLAKRRPRELDRSTTPYPGSAQTAL
jgi:hypothetical protein